MMGEGGEGGKPEEKKTAQGTQETLAPEEFFELMRMKLDLCVQLQHPLRRWRTVHMIHLPKTSDNPPKIEKLRTIHIFDCELNLLRQKFIAQRAMHNMEKEGRLDDDQWGGHQGRQSVDLALHQELLLG